MQAPASPAWFFRLVAVYTAASLGWLGLLAFDFARQPWAPDPAFHSVALRWLIAVGVVPAGLALAGLILRRSPGNINGLALLLWTVVVMGGTLRADSPLVPYSLALSPGAAGPWLLGLYFPDGRAFPERWGRSLRGLSVALIGLISLGAVCQAQVGAGQSNPLFIPLLQPLGPVVLTAELAALSAHVGLILPVLFGRYRAGAPRVRQQLKWLLWAFAMLFGLMAAAGLADLLGRGRGGRPLPAVSLTFTLYLGLFPYIAVGNAILRHRLYDVDLLIRRTLIYTLVSGALAGVYFGGIVLLQVPLGALTGPAAPAGLAFSTLATMALFAPLRRRVQDLIDRRFDRPRYDAAQTLAAFAAAVRDETDLVRLTARLTDIVQTTLQPERVQLWLTGAAPPPLDLTPADERHLRAARQAVEIAELSGPARTACADAGFNLLMPLRQHGDLVGGLALGPRRSEQAYGPAEHAWLQTLAAQTAPAIRVAQLVQEQQRVARTHERLEQELRVAGLIQQTLLPQDLPALPGWSLAAHYRPARAVGGDFYDFIPLLGGRLGLVIGDVTDKGVPAALVMATTRSLLRVLAEHSDAPGEVLAEANARLCPTMPAKMFVTCFYAILDPATGRLGYANAGHDVPYRRSAGGISELRATGMPLGLLPGMTYAEGEVTLAAGDSVLFYSDGIVEAHAPDRTMFGLPRLQALLAEPTEAAALIPDLLRQLAAFTGAGWEQEDDLTLVTLQRQPAALRHSSC